MPRFTSASAAASGSAGGLASGVSRRASAKRHIADLKIVAHHDATSPDTPVAVKASLMRAYVDLHEIEMAITGQGKPKPVEARNATPKRKPRSAGPVGDAAPTRAREPLSPQKDNAPAPEQSPAAGNAT